MTPAKHPKTVRAWRVAAQISLSYGLAASVWIYASDALLAQLSDCPPFLISLQTYKGWLFVAVTAALLYGLIGSILARKQAQAPSAADLGHPFRTEPTRALPSFWQGARTPLLIFLLLASVIGGMGYLVHAHQRHVLQKATADELSTIADHKVAEINHWLTERRSDAEILARDPFLVAAVGRWLSAGTPTDADGQRLRAWLTDLKETFAYRAVLLIDPGGQVRSGIGDAEFHAYRPAVALQAIASGQAVLSDLHWRQEAVDGPIEMDLIAPVGRKAAGTDQPLGALVFKIDPGQYLFPVIQRWPTASPSAETLLVRQEGEAVVYLNELRHRSGTALQLRLPLTSAQLPAARAVRGHTGMVEGVDYRQVPVLAVGRAVPGTAWFLVAKIDAEEVYAPLRTLMRLTALVGSLLILAAGVGTAFWWRQQYTGFVAERLRRELERQALAQRFDYLSKYANDSILLMDRHGQILEANERAVAAYGYPHQALLRLNIRALHAPDARAQAAESLTAAARSDGRVFETVHQRHDGTCFPVEVSARKIDLQGQGYLQSIIRDISERQRAEEALRDSEARYRVRSTELELLMEAIPAPVWIAHDPDCHYISGNRAATEVLGLPVGENPSATPPRGQTPPGYQVRINGQVIAVEALPMQRAAATGQPMRDVEMEIIGADGQTRWAYGSAVPLFDDAGEVRGCIGAFVDITARKRTEEALRASEERRRLALNSGGMGTWLWDLDSQGLTWDARQYELFGMEATGRPLSPERFFNLIHPQDRERLRRSASALLDGADHWDEEFRILLPTGQVRWLAGRGELQRDTTGRALRVIGVNFDITVRKQAEQALARERELLQSIINTIPVMIAIYDPKLQAFRLNAEIERVLGWTAEEARQVDFMEKCYPDPDYRAQVAQYMQSLQPGWRDLQVTAKDGSLVASSWANIRLSDDTQVGIGIDIRERRQAEAALRRANERITGILESISDGFISLDRAGRCAYVNPTAARWLRRRPEELVGQTVWEVVPLVAGTAFEREFRRALEGQEWVTFEAYHDSLATWYECHCYPSPEGLSVFFTDTTERKRAEQALRDSEERLRLAAQAAGFGTYHLNLITGESYWSPEAKAIAGLPLEASLSLERLWELIHPQDYERVRRKMQAASDPNGTGEFEDEHRLQRPDGSLRWVLVRGRIFFEGEDSQREPVRATGILLDITQRKQAEEALRASEAQLARTQRIAHLGSWEIDLTPRRESWSEETYRLLGYAPRAFEPTYDRFLSRVHPQDRERVSHATTHVLHRGECYDLTFRIVRANGEERVLHLQGEAVFDEAGQTVGLRGAVQDITERTRMEAQLREQERHLIQASKLAALGTLVSGVAHEINNPNNLILLNAQLLSRAWADLAALLAQGSADTEERLIAGLPYAEMRETLPTLIQDIHQGALRIQKIVADLKDFVRPGAGAGGAAFNLNEIIRRALNLLGHTIKQRTEHLQVDLAPALPPLLGNAQQIEQVIVNLVLNALEALPDKTRAVTLSTRLNPAAGCIEVRVQDEGIGIAPEHLNRICEPFFTTKQDQQGTGLGLFMAYKLVTAHRGTLSFESEPGRGTVALVKLPLVSSLQALPADEAYA